MHNKNPMITDLGDINRPTKLAEQFSVLYDNEWTDAFDSVARMAGQTQNIEKDIIIYLVDVLRVCLFVCLFVCLLVCLFVCLFACLFVCLMDVCLINASHFILYEMLYVRINRNTFHIFVYI